MAFGVPVNLCHNCDDNDSEKLSAFVVPIDMWRAYARELKDILFIE